MAESIAVGYREIDIKGVYHKFIVYTDSCGNQWVTSGFPEKQPDGSVSDLLPRGFPGSGSSQTDFGLIVTKGGTSNPRRNDSNYPGYPKNSDGRDKHPGKNIEFETVKTGDNLSDDWKKVTDAMDALAGEKHQYRPLENSNTAADEAHRRAGISEPKDDDFGENWAPGYENNLPGGSDDAGGGGGGSGATAPGGIGGGGGTGGAGGGGGWTESMEPGNTHWALMDWTLESAEGTSHGSAAKRIRLGRRSQNIPTLDQCKNSGRYPGLAANCHIDVYLALGRGCWLDVLIPRRLCFWGLNSTVSTERFSSHGLSWFI